MARAQFHKNQRVFVKPVGTWALIERVVPQWTKGLDEPIRIFYDVGLGRDFAADELQGDTALDAPQGDVEDWRVQRARNRWQSPEETKLHPYPGTYPVVLTGEHEWGGWRVPGGEYAMSPARIERQARMMAATPRLVAIAKDLKEWAKQSQKVPDGLKDLVQKCDKVIDYLNETTE